jgi:hypothetical protein
LFGFYFARFYGRICLLRFFMGSFLMKNPALKDSNLESSIKSIVEDLLNSELVKLELRKSIDNLALKGGYTSNLIARIIAGDEAAIKEGEELTGRNVPDIFSEAAGDAAGKGRHQLARNIGVEPAVAPTKETSKFNRRRERVGALQDAISEALDDTKSVMGELKKSIDNLALKSKKTVPKAEGEGSTEAKPKKLRPNGGTYPEVVPDAAADEAFEKYMHALLWSQPEGNFPSPENPAAPAFPLGKE